MKSFREFILENIDLDTHLKYAEAGIPLPDIKKLKKLDQYNIGYDKSGGGYVLHDIHYKMITHLNRDRELSRSDGPAVEYANGEKRWYKNGYLHRKDGPAVEFPSGNKEYWKNGKQVSPLF